ncbi:MAG: LysR family transcriptional regulator [Clostridiales bacterium]|nr:LysR family transcriptional regulator [Clostridiales bacterium]
MDFRQLEAFVNVAKYKNFSKAGKALYLSQPTISLHISNLEKELSVSLFDRTSKEVNLTPSGKEFLTYALDMINMKNKALHHIMTSENTISGSIHISTSTTPNLVLLPRAIKAFQQLNPDVKFIIEEKSSTLILEDVCSLNSDLGLVGMKVESDRFFSTHLFDDELVFICSKDAPLDGVVEISELAGHNFIGRTDQSATRVDLERAMVEQGIDVSMLENIIEIDNMNLTLQLVAENVGISYMSKSIFNCYRNFINIKDFQIRGLNITRHIYLLTNRRRTLSPAVEDFVELLKKMEKPCDLSLDNLHK